MAQSSLATGNQRFDAFFGLGRLALGRNFAIAIKQSYVTERRGLMEMRGYARIASGSRPIDAHHPRYAMGETSDGLISLRPPQKTLV